MIEFYARMYNVTAQAYLDSNNTKYSIAEYTAPYTTAENPFVSHERTTITTIPATDYSVNAGTNIGTAFEYYAKRYYVDNSVWPVLRLLTTTSIDDYYLEWTHNNPHGFYIKAGDTSFWWDSAFQWSDAIAPEGSPAQYYSYVFVTAGTVSELNNFTELIFGGAYHISDDTETLVCNSVSTFTCNPPWMLITAANTLLLTIADSSGTPTNYRKTYNGPAYCRIAKYKQSASDTSYRLYGYLIAPNNNQNASSSANGNELPPWSVYTSNSTRKFVTVHPAGSWYSGGFRICYCDAGKIVYPNYTISNNICPIEDLGVQSSSSAPINTWFNEDSYTWIYFSNALYTYLTPSSPLPPPEPPVPPSDVDPDNPPDPDEPPAPIPPDDQDPYYDPTSDPDSPEYDPTKDPDSPEYDPSEPDTPHRPPSTEDGGDPPVKPPVDPVTPPPTPPSHAINSRFVTLYTPSLSQLNALAEYLWSPAWSIDGFKKIFANPMDCILGLMIFPALAAPSGSKEVNVGNLSTGVTMSYIDNQYVEVNCGSFEITEYYASYLDYDPYTKIEIYLPYIGTHRLSADDVMAKTIQLKYMIDLLSGACVAFLVVDGTTLYTFTGSCATPIPVSGNDWSNMVNGILSVAGAATAAVISGGTAATMAAGALASTSLFVSSHKEHIRHGGSVASAAGLMSIQTPYLIVTRPRQALPIGQNSFQGYPSFMTESLGSLTGYTEVESCHLEHIPCTDEELKEIERLLKGGVLF